MAYVRDRYHVPAKRGRRVRWGIHEGRITSARGGYILVRCEVGRRVRLHPTCDVVYLDDDGGVLMDTRGAAL